MDAFVTEKVVPEVIDAVPPAGLQVTFGTNSFNPGATMTLAEVKDKPTVTFVAESGALYALLEIDHDAPSRTDHSRADILHWKVINIQGSDVSSGVVVADYRPPHPPKDSGFHRYTFLLYKQPHGQIDPSQYALISPTTSAGRVNYSTREFVRKYDLELVAGNFFMAQWEDHTVTSQVTRM